MRYKKNRGGGAVPIFEGEGMLVFDAEGAVDNVETAA